MRRVSSSHSYCFSSMRSSSSSVCPLFCLFVCFFCCSFAVLYVSCCVIYKHILLYSTTKLSVDLADDNVAVASLIEANPSFHYSTGMDFSCCACVYPALCVCVHVWARVYLLFYAFYPTIDVMCLHTFGGYQSKHIRAAEAKMSERRWGTRINYKKKT